MITDCRKFTSKPTFYGMSSFHFLLLESIQSLSHWAVRCTKGPHPQFFGDGRGRARACPARSPSVEGTIVYRQYLPPRADSSDFGRLWKQSFPKMVDSLPRTPVREPRAKFDAASFILAGEIRNRKTNKQTNKQEQ